MIYFEHVYTLGFCPGDLTSLRSRESFNVYKSDGLTFVLID